MTINPFIFASYGILIVFSGLAFLAISVSNIHRIISFFGKRKEIRKKLKNRKNKKSPPLTNRMIIKSKQLSVITEKKEDESFYLPELIDKSLKTGMENPWETIDFLIKKEIIIPDDKGMFLWNTNSYCFRKINKTDL